MPVHHSVMAKIIRDGMDEYWRVIYAPSEEGMTSIEIGWRREHAATMKRLNDRFGAKWDEIFKEG